MVPFFLCAVVGIVASAATLIVVIVVIVILVVSAVLIKIRKGKNCPDLDAR